MSIPEKVTHFNSLVRERRSVRGFLEKPVPDEIIKEIFEIARWSPSGTNVQPWHVAVVSGEKLNTIRQGFLERFDAGEKVVTDHPPDQKTPAPWQDRKRACAKALYDSMGIEWEDRPGRAVAARRNYEFFDAPHAVFLSMHDIFGTQTASDVGMYAQTLMLAMTAYGVASCSQGTLRNYPDFVRETLGIDPDIKILFGISFGYEDPNVGANNTRTERASLAETVHFYQ